MTTIDPEVARRVAEAKLRLQKMVRDQTVYTEEDFAAFLRSARDNLRPIGAQRWQKAGTAAVAAGRFDNR